MPEHAPSRAIVEVEVEDLTIELDQRNAELELARGEARSWRAIAHLLANSLRSRLDVLDLVELDHTLGPR